MISNSSCTRRWRASSSTAVGSGAGVVVAGGSLPPLIQLLSRDQRLCSGSGLAGCVLAFTTSGRCSRYSRSARSRSGPSPEFSARSIRASMTIVVSSSSPAASRTDFQGTSGNAVAEPAFSLDFLRELVRDHLCGPPGRGSAYWRGRAAGQFRLFRLYRLNAVGGLGCTRLGVPAGLVLQPVAVWGYLSGGLDLYPPHRPHVDGCLRGRRRRCRRRCRTRSRRRVQLVAGASRCARHGILTGRSPR